MINKKFAILAFFAVLAVLLFSCGGKKELAVGNIVKKRFGDEKLKLMVLSVNEHDGHGNIIHKRIGNYAPQTKGSEKITYFEPQCNGFYDVWYDNEYDESGNLTRTFIHNSKDTETWDYSFKYDDGKIVYVNTKIHQIGYKEGYFDEYECFYDYDEKGSVTHYKASKEDTEFLPEELKYYEWDYQHEYKDDSAYTKSYALFTKYQIRRIYDQSGKIEHVRLSNDLDKKSIDVDYYKDPIIEFYYGKTMNTEYYYNYTKRFYGYGDYFGSKTAPLDIDGKLNFNTLNWDHKNRDSKTVFEYYLRKDGTVEKSIEYTGKAQFKHYKTMEFRRKHGGWATYDVPTLIPFYEYK